MISSFFFLMIRRPPRSTLFPLHDALPISLHRKERHEGQQRQHQRGGVGADHVEIEEALLDVDGHRLCAAGDRKSTRLNSSHANISYAVFCLKKKTSNNNLNRLTFDT